MGELAAMLEGKERSEWARTSATLCLIATGFSAMGGKRKKFKPSDFDPFQKQSGGVRMGPAEFGSLLFGSAAKAGKATREAQEPPPDRPPPPPARVRSQPR